MRRLHGYYFEDLEVGMTAEYAKTVTDADIVIFAGVTGDHNPLHMNEEFARESMFGTRIIHGMLTASFISAVIGTKLPGPGCIYVSQNIRFKAPVKPGDTVNVSATIKEMVGDKRRATLSTVCMVRNKVVLEGEAVVIVPSRLAADRVAGTAAAD
jgi:3-hydroxybutyryl-CoA dehydratase